MSEEKWQWLVPVAVIAALALCLVWHFTHPETPLERECHRIIRDGTNCYLNGTAMAEAYWRLEKRKTSIVAAFGPEAGSSRWHCFLRDDKGKLHDTTDTTVLAEPVFEFDYVPGMETSWTATVMLVKVNGEKHIQFEIPNQQAMKYFILHGAEYVQVHIPSE